MRRRRWVYGAFLVAPLLWLADYPSAAQAPQSAASYESTVQPLFGKYCSTCHNAALETGGLNLDGFDTAASVLQQRETFELILRRLKAGEMPPKGSPRPSGAEVTLVASWIQGELDRIDASTQPDVRVLARRLNRTEYNNTIRDLLGVHSQPAADFPPDDSAFGFDNIAQALSISPSLMEKYLATAERVAREAVFGLPVKKNQVAMFTPPVPRRMEFTNRLKVEPPAYYSMFDYDLTGLSQPGSLHLTYQFPVDSEYPNSCCRRKFPAPWIRSGPDGFLV